MPVIEAHKLTKYYGRARGIKNVSFSVEEGEIFGFIGPNGAGKSTTIRTLLALIYPTRGTGKIFGKDCIKDHKEIANEVGYLPSEIFYYDHMKVKDLLNYSASFYKKDCTQRIKVLCDRLELDVNRKIDDLSLGNRKKVGIVQGLLHEPKLIILDEPTSGLDPLMQQTFFDLIKEENAKGVTVFFSSHILSEVQKICDRVAIIKEGKIIDVKKIDELKEANYKRVNLRQETALTKEFFALEGIENLVIEDTKAAFIYNGKMDPLVKQLSHLNLTNLNIEDPDLE